jgi:hypothetical protein
MIRSLIVAAFVSAAMAVPSSAVSAEPDTFDGSCQWHGVVEFTPALSLRTTLTTGHASAQGSCSGTLHQGGQTTTLDSVPSSYVADNAGRMSCFGGSAQGHGYFDIAGTRLEFNLAETRFGPISFLRLTGPGLLGTAVVEPRAGVDAVSSCASTGLGRVPVSIVVHTSRSVSG